MNHIGTKRLSTRRLILRPFSLEDAPAMFQNWANDPEVSRYVTWPPHGQLSVTQALLEEWTSQYLNPDFYHWCITKRENGEAIGDISVVKQSQRDCSCEIGYCLSRAYWGNGIVTEAFFAVLDFLFTQVQFHRVEAEHVIENPASGNVMKKCGLQFEGISRESTLLLSDHQFHDIAHYAILQKDWVSKKTNDISDEKRHTL